MVNDTNFKPEFWPAFVIDRDNLPEVAPFPTCKAQCERIAIAICTLADKYTSFCKHEFHLKNGKVEKIHVEGYAWKTALKIASYVLIILPILALMTKAIYKHVCTKNVTIQKAVEEKKTDQQKPEKAEQKTQQSQQDIMTPEKKENPEENKKTSKAGKVEPKQESVPEAPKPTEGNLQPEPKEMKSEEKDSKAEQVKSTKKTVAEKSTSVNKIIAYYKIGKTTINIKEGDITQDNSEILVNAANASLEAGLGVCGAFYEKAGQEIFDECKSIKKALGDLSSIPTGHAVMTTAGALGEDHVVLHAVGPIWSNVDLENSNTLLKNVIENSLKMAAGIDVNEKYISEELLKKSPKNKKYRSIAIPAISTGIFGFPLPDATKITAQAVKKFLKDHSEGPEALDEINFVFLESDKKAEKYLAAFEDYFKENTIP